MKLDPSSPPRLPLGRLRSAWEWLIEPLIPLPTASSRRPRLLAWLLLSMLLLAIASPAVVLLADPAGSLQRAVYLPFILGLAAIVMLAYVLNRAGYYSVAAGLVVVGALLVPWGSVLIDPSILRGDFVPLGYTIISVLLSSILLSPSITAVLAAAQLVALALIAFANPATVLIDWPSFLALIFVTSVLCILSSVVSEEGPGTNRPPDAPAGSK